MDNPNYIEVANPASPTAPVNYEAPVIIQNRRSLLDRCANVFCASCLCCGTIVLVISSYAIIKLILFIMSLVPNASCPIGYTAHKELLVFGCYKAHLNTADFHMAYETCHNESASLATIWNKKENDYIVDLMESTLHKASKPFDRQFGLQIGYTYENSTWKWVDGANSTFTNWKVGYPKLEDVARWAYIQLKPNSTENKWMNGMDTDQHYFVCYKPIHIGW